MLTQRLFIAVPVPPDLQEILRQHCQSFFPGEAIRPLPAANLHLTVYFLGEVPATQRPTITQALQAVAATHAPFTLNLANLEPGPKASSPRLIWARCRPQPAFTELVAAVYRQLARRPPDYADPIPHITLARFRKDQPRPVSLPTVDLAEQHVTLPVLSVALWESALQSPHPAYRILAEFALGTAITKNLTG